MKGIPLEVGLRSVELEQGARPVRRNLECSKAVAAEDCAAIHCVQCTYLRVVDRSMSLVGTTWRMPPRELLDAIMD